MEKNRNDVEERLKNYFDTISPSLKKQVHSTMVIATLMADEMKRKNISVQAYAKLFKISPVTMKYWLSGTYDFKVSQLCRIEEKLGINLFNVVKYKK